MGGNGIICTVVDVVEKRILSSKFFSFKSNCSNHYENYEFLGEKGLANECRLMLSETNP